LNLKGLEKTTALHTHYSVLDLATNPPFTEKTAA